MHLQEQTEPVTALSVISALSLAELVRVAQGRSRLESETRGELSASEAAIDLLAGRALTCEEAAGALFDVIRSANRWEQMERAEEKFLLVASVGQLQALAEYLYWYFWEPGEYGGGRMIAWRFIRVADRLEGLGVPLASAVPGVPTEKLSIVLDVGRECAKELGQRAHW